MLRLKCDIFLASKRKVSLNYHEESNNNSSCSVMHQSFGTTLPPPQSLGKRGLLLFLNQTLPKAPQCGHNHLVKNLVMSPPLETLHYENLLMQYTDIFKVVKKEKIQLKHFDIFLIFAQNIDCGYTLEPPRRGGAEAVLTSTHNLCFGAKIRKIGIPLYNPVLLYKGGVYGGIHYTDMFS